MPQKVKTVEYAFDTRLTTLATLTALAGTTFNTFAAITVQLPESSKTIRSAVLHFTIRDAETTTARRVDGARIGVQIDAVAFSDVDLTGTGITNTGDHYQVYMCRDVTSYFVTNYTGTSHTVGARIEFETDVASLINNITCKLVITYEYNDAASTQVKTVRIPMEGITGFLSTTANTNLRGSAAAGQIPDLSTFLPELSKTYDKIWFEVEATDAGAAVTDFNANYSINGGATQIRATLEQGLNTSVRFFDIFVNDGLTTNAQQDFQAWSSLASRFERMYVTLCVTYRFDATNSTTILNSILIPVKANSAPINSTAAADQDVYDSEFWIEEPATISMLQSAVRLFFQAAGAVNLTVSVQGFDQSGGNQGTTNSLYTTTALVQGGSFALQHRLDLAHGGTAVTLGRGKNRLRLKIFASAAGQATGAGGYYILNYTSGKSSAGIGSHNQTTEWQLCTTHDGTIAGTASREVATTNQRTPNFPEANYFLNGTMSILEVNQAANGGFGVMAETLSGEGPEDGWAQINTLLFLDDAEYSHRTFIAIEWETWNHYPGDPNLDNFGLNPETTRKQRIYGTVTMQSSLRRIITSHSVTFTVSGTISGSSGGTVNIRLLDATTFEILKSTSRVGNGAYSFDWFDDTRQLIVVAVESDTLKGASKQDIAGTGFDVDFIAGSSAQVGGRIMIS